MRKEDAVAQLAATVDWTPFVFHLFLRLRIVKMSSAGRLCQFDQHKASGFDFFPMAIACWHLGEPHSGGMNEAIKVNRNEA